MANGMGTLYIASSGLRNSQNALNTTANNLANVDTEGYVRQQVVFSDKEYNTFAQASISPQQAGLGLNIADVVHARDYFLDKAYRSEIGREAFYEASFTAVDEIQTYFQEMDGEAFQSAMTDFWTAFQELAKDPSDSVIQNLVVQKASLFLSRAQTIYDGTKDYQSNINVRISEDIQEINKLGSKIQALNERIRQIEGGGMETAMDLRDERDAALDRLGELAKISFKEDVDGVVTVKLEDVLFVDGIHSYPIAEKVDKLTGFITPYWPQLSNEELGTYDEVFDFSVRIHSDLNTDIGELKALVLARGDHWANYTDVEGMTSTKYESTTAKSVMIDTQAKIDQLMHTVMTSINNVLSPLTEGPAGVTYVDKNGDVQDLGNVRILDAENCATGSDGKIPPRELFVRAGMERYTEVTGSDGNTYYVYNEEDLSDTSYMYSLTSCSINEDLKKSETFLPHLRQNGEVDQPLGEKLAALWEEELLAISPSDPEPITFANYYQKLIGELGTTGNVYQQTANSLSTSVESITNSRQQVIGVSSDEELTNMIKYQNAYNASSRFMTVVSEMIEHIITNL